MTTPFEIRRRTPAGQIRYAAQQLEGVYAQDSAQQNRLIAVGFLLEQIADSIEAASPFGEPDLARECGPRPEPSSAGAGRLRFYADIGFPVRGKGGVTLSIEQLRLAARLVADERTAQVPCSLAVLRQEHDGHGWEPQPGMDEVQCFGRRGAAVSGHRLIVLPSCMHVFPILSKPGVEPPEFGPCEYCGRPYGPTVLHCAGCLKRIPHGARECPTPRCLEQAAAFAAELMANYPEAFGSTKETAVPNLVPRRWRGRMWIWRHTTRASRAQARRESADTLVRIWLRANPGEPLESARAELPLSWRRIRDAARRIGKESAGA